MNASVKQVAVSSDDLGDLQKQLNEAIKAEASALRSRERAEKKHRAAGAVVEQLQNELGLRLLASWGNTPDLAILLSSDGGYGMAMYKGFLSWVEHMGLTAPGGYFPDVHQRVIGVGINAADVTAVERAEALICSILPALKLHDDDRRWLRIDQQMYSQGAWELRVTQEGQADLVYTQYNLIEEELAFPSIREALKYIQEHLPSTTTYENDAECQLISEQ